MSSQPHRVHRGRGRYRAIASVCWLACSTLLATCGGLSTSDRPEPLPHPVAADTPETRREQDLDYLVATFDAIHPDPFMRCPEVAFRAEVETVRRALSELDDNSFQLALMRLVASLRDAHSDMDSGVGGYPIAFPCWVEAFDEEFRVVRCAPDHLDLLGARVMTINDHPMDVLLEAIGDLIAAANPQQVRVKSPGYLIRPLLLYQLGLGEHPDRMVVDMVLRGGEPVSRAFDIREVDGGSWHHILSDFESCPKTMHETNHESGARYWWEVFSEDAILYFQFNKCREHEAYSFEVVTREILARLDQGDIETVVIDVRYNTGGNNHMADPFTDGLAARAERGEPERVLLLTGATTFSSGVDVAVVLRETAGATLVGTATGGMPNSFGNAVRFTLPNSGIEAQCSSAFFRLIEDDPPTLEPHVDLGRPWSDYSVGRDTAMEWVRDTR